MVSGQIVVIGASAGGVEAVTRLVRDLPADFAAPVFVTLHFPAYATSALPQILSRAGRLQAVHPQDGAAIEPATIYVAPPDQHLIIRRNRIRLVRGPRENGNRPAIDPMFRSAAVAYGARVVGIVLTGSLDDGTAGLLAIKRRGGIAIVQDPSDALFPSMPASAIAHVPVDHVLPLDEIPRVLRVAVSTAAKARAPIAVPPADSTSDDDSREVRHDSADLDVIEAVEQHPGEPSPFGCPDCGGVLWHIEDGDLLRFRCRVGHAWSSEALMARQRQQLDAALWAALRALEESVSLTRLISKRARTRGNDTLAAKLDHDADETAERATVVRGAHLTGVPRVGPEPDQSVERSAADSPRVLS